MRRFVCVVAALVSLVLVFTAAGCGTSTPKDTDAPTISNLDIPAKSSSSATITWTTSEGATSQVEYGLTQSYGSSSALDATFVMSHSITLTGLTSGVTYHCRVKSVDAAGNEAESADCVFQTDTVVEEKATWHSVVAINPSEEYTSGEFHSNLFECQGEKFRLTWTAVPLREATPSEEAGVFAIFVYPEAQAYGGSPSSNPVKEMSLLRTTTSLATVYEGPGRFGLNILYAYIQSWSVLIEAYY
jgi:hypothetical protein